MKVGILGTGVVAETIGSKLTKLGHEVMISGRAASSEKGSGWVARAQAMSGGSASYGRFADAAAFGEIVFHCTKGETALDVVGAAKSQLEGKILVDVSNPLDFSKGSPPTLFVMGTDSLGERLQRALPKTKVVKALNTVNCEVMVDPARLGGATDVFVSGNDSTAKATVRRFLVEEFGWTSVVDLGDIQTARGTEAYVLLWIRLMGPLKTTEFNLRLVRK